MVRTDRYKLIVRYPEGQNLLVDLQADPREITNLYYRPEYQALAASLTEQINAYFGKHQDPVKNGLRVLELPPHNNTEAWRTPS